MGDLQQQDVLWISDAAGGDGRVLLDPNTWSGEGTVALVQAEVSPDGRLLAYAVSAAGSSPAAYQ